MRPVCEFYSHSCNRYMRYYCILISFLKLIFLTLLINLVYLLVNENEVKNINKSLNEKITFIEDFVVLFDSNNNLYKVLKEITTRLKKNHHIFNSLKNHSDIIKFTFTGLSSEFIPLIEYLHILNKNLTSKSNNTELLIDLEIINHKIEILKTLSNSI